MSIDINKQQNIKWDRFKKYSFFYKELGLMLDISRIFFDDNFFESLEKNMQLAYKFMDSLEKGDKVNKDEDRMVGHYWLRNYKISPNKNIELEIKKSINDIKIFVKKIEKLKLFKYFIIIGIGGSILSTKFVLDSLLINNINTFFIDNTDPEGINIIINKIYKNLKQTLCIVISKSGNTPETLNGLQEIKNFYKKQNISFEKHAIAITKENSNLYNIAKNEKWIKCFNIWEWVGGRTSFFSAVGLLPCALNGIKIDEMILGAKKMDNLTRKNITNNNPAALIALTWFFLTKKDNKTNMIILPYKDRLSSISYYLQQLIMESLGKEYDENNKIVNEGISVYGNKGSSDQHSYMQQILEGRNDSFVFFIEVLKNNINKINDNNTADYLHSFLLGTRDALELKNRQSILLTIEKISPFIIGSIIAMFERTVGLYAYLININAYNQPAVEKGKKIAENFLELKKIIHKYFIYNPNTEIDVETLSNNINNENKETIFKILLNMSFNKNNKITIIKKEPLYKSLFKYN